MGLVYGILPYRPYMSVHQNGRTFCALLVSLIFFRQDTHPILFPYRYIYSGPYMKAHPLYLEKFEYSPSLIFPKFSVLIISSLIKASFIKK